MSKRIYISADYDPNNGDQKVVEVLHNWCSDPYRRLEFYDTANPSCGSVSSSADCRPCDLKKEFNKQINASSAVVFIVGDKTASRTAGSSCHRIDEGAGCECTPYKQNTNGTLTCKVEFASHVGPDDDIGNINAYSYLEHEFRQAIRRNKNIVIIYNSLYNQDEWLPSYMKDYSGYAHPFWKKNYFGEKVGDYQYILKALGYD